MPPRSFNGWVQKLMDERGMTLGEAQVEAARCLEDGFKHYLGADQDSLFEDSERTKAASGGDHPPQEGARQRPPSAPSKDSGREHGALTPGTGAGADDSPSVAPSPRPEYDPRTSDWQGF